jgi:hypothetical protein
MQRRILAVDLRARTRGRAECVFARLQVVARDGIEPPTPAFSGPRSTTELSGLGEPKDAASA